MILRGIRTWYAGRKFLFTQLRYADNRMVAFRQELWDQDFALRGMTEELERVKKINNTLRTEQRRKNNERD